MGLCQKGTKPTQRPGVHFIRKYNWWSGGKTVGDLKKKEGGVPAEDRETFGK